MIKLSQRKKFQKILVETPNIETVKDILLNLRPIYEQFHSVEIEDNIIELIISLANKYIYDRNEPDKSIDLLDEVGAYTKEVNKKVVTKNLLKKIVLENIGINNQYYSNKKRRNSCIRIFTFKFRCIKQYLKYRYTL